MTAQVLVVDNYDSFVYNLVQYLGQLGAHCVVRRNDTVSAGELASLHVDGVLLSPGPGIPQHAGCSIDMVHACAARRLPLLGVCLGHQAVGVVYGGQVVRATDLLHGKTSDVHHDGRGVFAGLPDPLVATRYHSLVVDESGLSDEVTVTARTTDGVDMGLRHRELPIESVQFHPESVLTQCGHLLLANWLAACGDTGALALAPALAAAVEERRRATLPAS